MAALDVVILYSTFIEGFSRVIIEAMASGKPVIATELGGNVEAVIHGHNGLLVQPDNNPATLAQAIVDLAEGREERIRMGRNGRIRAEKLFDLRNCVARIETVYSDLLVDK
jgi:glycosyltransferase involved in cell wall biosynthesis